MHYHLVLTIVVVAFADILVYLNHYFGRTEEENLNCV